MLSPLSIRACLYRCHYGPFFPQAKQCVIIQNISENVCVCKGQQQSVLTDHQQNPKRCLAQAETPSHHLHPRGNRITAQLIFAFRVWSSLTCKLLQTSLNNPNSFTRSMWVNADQDTVSSCLQNIWARSHLSIGQLNPAVVSLSKRCCDRAKLN